MILEKRTEDIACRYGGEELVLILPETQKINALVIAERIRQRHDESELEFEGNSLFCTFQKIQAVSELFKFPDFT